MLRLGLTSRCLLPAIVVIGFWWPGSTLAEVPLVKSGVPEHDATASREDFYGEWEGEWDGVWFFRFRLSAPEDPQASADRVNVHYAHYESLRDKGLSTEEVGAVWRDGALKIGNITLFIDPDDPDRGIATLGKSHERCAPMRRMVPRLWLSSTAWTAQVGEPVLLHLVLEAPEMRDVIGSDGNSLSVRLRGDPRVTSASWYEPIAGHIPNWTFHKPLMYTPSEPGLQEAGPFTIKVGNETYTSNTVTLDVLPAWEPGEMTFRFQVSHDVVEVGQPFTLTIRKRFLEADRDGWSSLWDWKTNDGPYKAEYLQPRARYYEEDGTRYISMYSRFMITPKEPGELRVDGVFRHNKVTKLNEEVPELTVFVLEPEGDR